MWRFFFLGGLFVIINFDFYFVFYVNLKCDFGFA